MRYDRKGAHCPGASLCDTACAVPQSAVSCGVVVCAGDVASVAVVCHYDVNWDSSFDGDWADLLAENSVEALGEVSDSSCKGMLVDNCMFQSDSECIMSVGCSLSWTGSNEAVHGPWFEDWVELGATVFSPKSVYNTSESEDAVV